MRPSIEITADGSPTLYLAELDEHYHSVHGAVTESRHVYIDCGLVHRASRNPENGALRVFEVGFGTGLNATLSAMTGIDCRYTSIEKFPLDVRIADELDFGESIDHAMLRAVHRAPWGNPERLTPAFELLKIRGDFTRENIEGQFDVIFMDAFAPEKQPEMWSEPMLAKLAAMLAPGGVLTTYCAKGHIRRTLRSLGLTAERLPGPPGGKREILRLTKPVI